MLHSQGMVQGAERWNDFSFMTGLGKEWGISLLRSQWVSPGQPGGVIPR